MKKRGGGLFLPLKLTLHRRRSVEDKTESKKKKTLSQLWLRRLSPICGCLVSLAHL